MLPQLADDTNAAKAVGGDRCYLSSPALCSQIVPSNKAINLIDQHINFTATFMLQLGERFIVLEKTSTRAAWLEMRLHRSEIRGLKSSPGSSLCALLSVSHADFSLFVSPPPTVQICRSDEFGALPCP